MPVPSAHPDAVRLDEAFAAAMDSPAKPREPGPPPEVDPEAPFGRGEDGAPLAPHGYKKDGSVRLTGAGRRPKDEQARVGDTPEPPKDTKGKTTGEPAAGQYAPAIADTLEVGWLGLSTLGEVGPKIPLVGRFLPGQKLHAQAALVLTCKDQLAGALDLAAQHNASARRLAEKFAKGDINWAFSVCFMVMPFVANSVEVWQGNEQVITDLAKQNGEVFSDYFSGIRKKMEHAQQEAADINERADIQPEPEDVYAGV